MYTYLCIIIYLYLSVCPSVCLSIYTYRWMDGWMDGWMDRITMVTHLHFLCQE